MYFPVKLISNKSSRKFIILYFEIWFVLFPLKLLRLSCEELNVWTLRTFRICFLKLKIKNTLENWMFYKLDQIFCSPFFLSILCKNSSFFIFIFLVFVRLKICFLISYNSKALMEKRNKLCSTLQEFSRL